ncbi:hypothetical protein CAEBREN_11978 [Caenorhabditis brenneri]|uniref:Serpentine receptor class gamma n=1 Tax=Caenorhabditis brenneri TaxID=135651 RepID=G0NMZ2_CAEBE|nr:hypothetical protein CAEBREN_11978 [Caenorhabditis brenneri]
MNVVHFVFSTFVIIMIVVSTVSVVLKLRNGKKTSYRSVVKAHAETTLTVTTVLIIIPLILSQGLTITNFMNSPYFSYILVGRPLLLDLRVNVVSIYFYLTHPVFKKKKISSGPSTFFGSTTT